MSSLSTPCAIFLSSFPVEGSHTYKVLTDDQRLAVYQELLALSVNIKLRHVDGKEGYSLPHIKQQHRRSVGTAIRDIYCDETAYNYANAAMYSTERFSEELK